LRRPDLFPLRPTGRVRLAATATLSASLFSLACAAMPVWAQTIQVNKENRTISITATERVTTMADVAVVHIGFLVYGRDKDAAYNAGTQASGAIIKALGGAGISADAIESDNQGLAPVQNFQVERMSPAELANRRFQVQQSWLVRTTPAEVAHVLDIAVLAGANQSGQIDWALRDENAAGADAAARALQRARSVASQMAQGLNARLGELLYASNESESSTVRPVPMMAMHKAADASETLAISPRRIEKTATVRAIFAIYSASAP
jgi:uncharacterized protein YggE